MSGVQRSASASERGAQLRLRGSAEHLADAFPPLLVAAERIAVSMVQGIHGRRRSGPGEDFWQYRHYSPGDPVQRIDWRKSARSDKVLIRENEWDASNTLWLWASKAPGMSFRSRLSQSTKQDRAVLLALTLGILAVRAGERVAALGNPYPPDHTNRALMRIAKWYSLPAEKDEAPLPGGKPLPRFSSCILFGDFLSPIEDIAEAVSTLAGNGVRGHLVQILDPAEETFPYEGRTEFLEYSGPGKLVLGKAETLREQYAGRLAAHRAGLTELARRLNWSFAVHHTDQPPSQIILALHGLLSDELHQTATGMAG